MKPETIVLGENSDGGDETESDSEGTKHDKTRLTEAWVRRLTTPKSMSESSSISTLSSVSPLDPEHRDDCTNSMPPISEYTSEGRVATRLRRRSKSTKQLLAGATPTVTPDDQLKDKRTPSTFNAQKFIEQSKGQA